MTIIPEWMTSMPVTSAILKGESAGITVDAIYNDDMPCLALSLQIVYSPKGCVIGAPSQ
jgi:hypothetical protein